MTLTVALVHDAGPHAGLGHLRRMEVLAAALRARGATCRILPVGAVTPPADVTVVDAYSIRADEAGCWNSPVLVAVDDLERDLAVDLVVDPNPLPTAGAGRRAGTTLTGTGYALVGPPPTDLAAVPVAHRVRTVLVTFGAAGAGGRAAEVAEALVGRLPAVRVQLSIGPWGGEPPAGVDAVVTDSGLLPLLARADLVVTAGGVTLLEALMLGRPTVASITADNQRRAVTGAVTAGAALAPDHTTVASLVDTVVRLAADQRGRSALAVAATRYVDGHGPARVSEAILALL